MENKYQINGFSTKNVLLIVSIVIMATLVSGCFYKEATEIAAKCDVLLKEHKVAEDYACRALGYKYSDQYGGDIRCWNYNGPGKSLTEIIQNR